MLFPSYEMQRDLMIKTYKEANIDPLKLTYFEAHATGTKVQYFIIMSSNKNLEFFQMIITFELRKEKLRKFYAILSQCQGTK